jgi:uncharacterized protein (DUF1697 family)
MKTYLAILRGINVSGKNVIKMLELKALFESLKFSNVKTYIQSGNVCFKAKAQKNQSIVSVISDAIKKQFNFDVPVIVFEADYLQNIIKENPFLNTKTIDETHLHITFFNSKPDIQLVNDLSLEIYKPDLAVWGDNAVYLYCPKGYGNTKLNNSFFEKKLKCIATTRNWKTVNVLLNMAKE